MKLLDISSAGLFLNFAIFCRIGSSLALLPGIGDAVVPSRIKLILALAITVLISGMKTLLPPPQSSIEIFLVMVSEISIGIAFGMTAKIILTSLYIAGHAISSHIGLSTAMMFDPNYSDQSTTLGTLLNITAVTIIVSLNLHIAVIDVLINSYASLPIGAFFNNVESFNNLIVKVVVTSWNVGIRFAAPFIVMSFLMYLAAGVLSRLMPQLQVFFLLLPAQILVGFIILTLFISAAMLWFIEEYKNFISQLI